MGRIVFTTQSPCPAWRQGFYEVLRFSYRRKSTHTQPYRTMPFCRRETIVVQAAILPQAALYRIISRFLHNGRERHEIFLITHRACPKTAPCRRVAGRDLGRICVGGGRMSIILDNLTVSYQARPAVHHVHMTFEKGCMYAIFGPNGAGKSTLLKAMMGLLPCNTGSVQWQGLQRRDIAYLPQQSDIDRSQPMNVFELAAMGLWYEIGCFGRVSAAQKQRVQAALERVEMWDLADRGIGALSNGQFQRVLLARMLVQDAQFLLLDEPFNAVDAKTTYALLDVLRQENRSGRAVIAVLHDYEQVRAYFPHTLLIAREKVACGKTEDVLCEEMLAKANALARKAEEDAWCEA